MQLSKGLVLLSFIVSVCFVTALAAIIATAIPTRAHALGETANAMCNPWFPQCPCNKVPDGKGGCTGGKNTNMCPPGVCFDVTNGLKTVGICSAKNKCEGTSGQGLGGEGTQMISQLLQQAMQQLMQGGGGGGGGGGMPASYTDPNGNNCTNYYQVTVPSSDPCAIYVPDGVLNAAGGQSGVASGLLDALSGGSSQSNVSDTLFGNINRNQNTGGTQSGAQQSGGESVDPGKQGLTGDLRVGGAGATIFANLREGLSEVAGFFGGSTGGASGALSAAGRLCSARPWQGSVVSNIIPSSFFDGLCQWSGYQVGFVTSTQSGQGLNIPGGTNTQGGTNAQTTTNPSDVPPEVDIWAEPASVRLGSRTYIFWNARGVVSCAARGPSFEQNTPAGGASTVPISGPTTFNIECMGNNGTTVTDSVTVQIAL